ncbi:MAG: hypothetical protein ACJ739_07185 [Acidimicrobiales bacterium]
MTVAALVLWIVTAIGGLTMAGTWLAHHGPAEHRSGRARISPARLVAHGGLAAAGLVLWIAHVATDEDALGWLALAILPFVALIGALMYMTWLAGRGADAPADRSADQHLPPLLVGAHGILAVATVVVVVIALVS